MRRPRLTDEEVTVLCSALDTVITMVTGAGGSTNEAVQSVDKKLQRLVDKIEREQENNGGER